MTATQHDPPDRGAGHRNEVLLVGRLAAEPRTVTLPSGDELATWRLVVSRPAASHGPPVDTLDCVADRAPARRTVAQTPAGELLEVQGSLRRRFYRSADGGAASRYEVLATRVRRVRPGRGG
jgi:single-strand DNA-binding protein